MGNEPVGNRLHGSFLERSKKRKAKANHHHLRTDQKNKGGGKEQKQKRGIKEVGKEGWVGGEKLHGGKKISAGN